MNHEAINQRIQALESELAGLKAELSKANTFKFDYINMKTSFIGTYCVYNDTSGSDPLKLENFRYRQLELNADADLQLQKELMCIGALAEQIDPDYKSKIDWNRTYSGKYFISYDVKNNTYVSFMRDIHRELGVVYMPKNTAEKVCEILNSKQVKI